LFIIIIVIIPVLVVVHWSVGCFLSNLLAKYKILMMKVTM